MTTRRRFMRLHKIKLAIENTMHSEGKGGVTTAITSAVATIITKRKNDDDKDKNNDSNEN